MKPKLRVTGIDKCLKFGELITSNVSQAIEKETQAGAKEIQKREQALAPIKTGKLRKSIVQSFSSFWNQYSFTWKCITNN